MMSGKSELLNDRDGGFALFAVLSFLLLAAAVATPFLNGARTKALVARNVTAELKDRLAARGLLMISGQRYIERIRLADPDLPRQVACNTESVSVLFTFQSHTGLIDLNAASPELLTLGFETLGASPGGAQLLAQAVVRFRTAASGPVAAEPLHVRGGYKHALFESVAELNDFHGPEGLDLANAGTVFTVHTGTGTIYQDEAPAMLALAINSLPPSAAYFVVQGRVPVTAVTVRADVQREAKTAFFADIAIRAKEAGSGFTQLSPMRLRHEASTATFQSGAQACEVFFGKERAAEIGVLAGEGA